MLVNYSDLKVKHCEWKKMATLKTPPPLDFSNSQEAWPEWIKRFQRFRQASGLDEKSAQRQIDTLIYIMGEEAEKVHTQLRIEKPTEEEVKNKPNELYDRTVQAFQEYFNPSSNTLHYSILLSNFVQQQGQSNEEFIRELYELVTKCGFSAEVQQVMIRMRLLAGMCDKELSRELQLDSNVTIEQIKSKMRAKETIENNQKKELDTDKTVLYVKSKSYGAYSNTRSNTRSSPTAQKTLSSKGAFKGRVHTKESDAATYTTNKDFIKDCRFCGNSHAKRRCPAYGRRCQLCKNFNHFAKVCPSKNTNTVEFKQDSSESESEFLYLDTLHVNVDQVLENQSKWLIDVRVNDNTFRAKVDTGAEVSVMSKQSAKRLGLVRIKRSAATLTGYTGKAIPVLGKIDLEVSVCFAGVERRCTELFYIVDQTSDTLIGLPAIKALNLIPSIEQVSANDSNQCNPCNVILSKFKEVFEGLGKYHTPVTLKLKQNAVPRASPPRLIPEKIRGKLKIELDRLVNEKIIALDKQPSEWLSRTVIVNKPDGSIRLCLDPQYLNTQLVRTQCTLATTTEIFSRVNGSRFFSCLDGKQGFHQLELDEESSRLTCFLTPFGKFKYLRLPMGITNAPEIFHKLMVDLLSDVPGVECYIDDVLIHAKTVEEHNKTLETVLNRFKQAGITLNKTKSVFCKNKVIFLGHELSEDGVRPHPEKVNALMEMVEPQTKKSVQSFLGFVGYLAKFIPNLSELATPLRETCKKSVEFSWQRPQQEAFIKIKQAISNAPTLHYFDTTKPVTISADSSSHSLGAVLLQDEKPIEFAAKSLTETQQRYSQIEKEMLAIVFACKRFKYFVWGRSGITVYTDHKPLIGLMTKAISELSPRLAQMRLKLLAFDITLEYTPGKNMVLADTLSRTCPAGTDACDELEIDPLLHVCQTIIRNDESMVKYRKATQTDEELPVVLQYIQTGWPTERKACASRALPYFNLRASLSEAEGIVMYGSRVVVPVALRSCVLNALHAAHQGVTKTVQRAQNSVFWPGLRKQIEDRCMSCDSCLRAEGEGKKEPLHPFEIPAYPFQTIGIDLFHVQGDNYLMIIDYLTKWPVVKPMKQSTSCQVVIDTLLATFADFGTPEKVISDNGPQFSGIEFRQFCNTHNIQHMTSSPLHSSGNGQVEKAIGTVKTMMKKCMENGENWYTGLLALRNTPVAQGLLAPSQYLQGRLLRDDLPGQQGNYKVQSYNLEIYREQLGSIKSKNKFYYDNHAGPEKKSLGHGQNCYFKTASGTWVPGIVDKMVSDRSYLLTTSSGRQFRRNRADIRPAQSVEKEVSDDSHEREVSTPETHGNILCDQSNDTGPINGNNDGEEPLIPVSQTEAPQSVEPPLDQARPKRQIKLPARFKDTILY